MKIAFIAGSLAPGRDGVGDYTRTLATECVRRGHAVRLLAVGETEVAGARAEAGVLRLSHASFRGDEGAAAGRWLAEFSPDWTSLQFVPYSFDPRGLFGASIPALVRVAGAAPRWHVFFHEIWIGAQRGARWKTRIVGTLQRRLVAKLLHALAPHRLHTSTEFYRAALHLVGANAGTLRMFGSVPHTAPVPAELPGVPPSSVVCGMFGTVHPDWRPADFLRDFAALAQSRGRPAALVSAGGLGPGAPMFARLQDEWHGRIACCALGRKNVAELAALFARFDFAVTSVPWNILGKSSSAAALREHGVRVVATYPGDPLRGAAPGPDDLADDEGFVPYFRDAALLARAPDRLAPRPGVSAIAGQFLDALTEVTP